MPPLMSLVNDLVLLENVALAVETLKQGEHSWCRGVCVHTWPGAPLVFGWLELLCTMCQ